jgi:hypothetical protein
MLQYASTATIRKNDDNDNDDDDYNQSCVLTNQETADRFRAKVERLGKE